MFPCPYQKIEDAPTLLDLLARDISHLRDRNSFLAICPNEQVKET